MSLGDLTAAAFLEEQAFDDVELAGASLADKELYRCSFTRVKAAESRWSACIFESCTFTDCDLTRADLVGVSFRGARFVRCKLLGVDFSYRFVEAFRVVRDCGGIVRDVGGQPGRRLDQPRQARIWAGQGGYILSQRAGAAQGLVGITMPQPPFDPLQAVLQRGRFDRVVVS